MPPELSIYRTESDSSYSLLIFRERSIRSCGGRRGFKIDLSLELHTSIWLIICLTIASASGLLMISGRVYFRLVCARMSSRERGRVREKVGVTLGWITLNGE